MARTTHCKKCNRTLKNPESQFIGYGPKCMKDLGIHLQPEPEQNHRGYYKHKVLEVYGDGL